MRIQQLPNLLLIVILFLVEACAPVYIPSARHTHQLDEKGELSSNVLAGTNGVDAQAAFAFTDRLGIIGAASFGKNEEEGSTDYHEHSYGEAGLEYFRPFGEMGRFELLAGGGMGSATSVDSYNFAGSNSEIQATGKYSKWFLQSNIGLETNWVETGLALRLGHVTFTEFETSTATYSESETGTFFEPSIFTRLGWKNIKIEGQVGTASLFQDESEVAFNYRPALVTLGIHLNLSTLP